MAALRNLLCFQGKYQSANFITTECRLSRSNVVHALLCHAYSLTITITSAVTVIYAHMYIHVELIIISLMLFPQMLVIRMSSAVTTVIVFRKATYVMMMMTVETTVMKSKDAIVCTLIVQY